MRGKLIALSVTCALLLVSLFGAACATTKTVTTTQIQTRTENQTATVPTTIITTITQTIGGETQTTVFTLGQVPPLIPHPILQVNGGFLICFSCHPVPVGHNGLLADWNTCDQCHDQGPIDPNILPQNQL